jgi:hypothetical protein
MDCRNGHPTPSSVARTDCTVASRWKVKTVKSDTRVYSVKGPASGRGVVKAHEAFTAICLQGSLALAAPMNKSSSGRGRE